MNSKRPVLERLTTGSPTFDRILGGGLPARSVNVIAGEPGAGKTLFALQMLFALARQGKSLLVGEYTLKEVANHAEFAIADGIIRFTNSRHELATVREVEVSKLRGADYVTGGHFYEIVVDGLTFFPRVRSPDDVGEKSAAGSERPVSSAERVATGVAGLDAMLGGGVPRASTTIVQGGTGTGKTLLGLQFLLEGARNGETGIHFLLEETPGQLRSIAHGLGWDLPALEKRGLVTLHYTSPVELSTDRFLDRARNEVEKLGARRAVVDSLTSMALGVPSERRFKELVYALAKHFNTCGVTLQMNMEVTDLLGAAQLSGQGVSFAADNVIRLKYLEIDGRLERGLSVLKARGVRHATDVRRLSVEHEGVRVGSAFEGLRGVLTGLPVSAKES